MFVSNTWNALSLILICMVTQTVSEGKIDDLHKELPPLIGDRDINIKIGVLNAEHRSKEQFWIEFDPGLPYQKTANNVILPFAVVANDSIKEIPFHFNSISPGCSSVNQPSHLYTDLEAMRVDFIKSCYQVEKEVQENPSKMVFTLWDKPSTAKDTIKIALEGTFKCYVKEYFKTSAPFPAITLNRVLNMLPHKNVHVLDIDSQGSDFELLVSISRHLPRVKHIRIECQNSMFIYNTSIPNSCNAAKAFLESFNFVVTRMEVNNCGVQEFNLMMSHKNHLPVV